MRFFLHPTVSFLAWLLVVDAYPGRKDHHELLQPRQSSGNVSANAKSPFDHTWIEFFTALGDSYSIGLGAGHSIKAARNVIQTQDSMTSN
jgi:hypothetical protein